MKLTAIGISYFRSIGQGPIWIDLTKKATVFIGANNCGKSNIFQALQFIRKDASPKLAETDKHQRSGNSDMVVHVRGQIEEGDTNLYRFMKEIEIGYTHSSERSEIVAGTFTKMSFESFVPIGSVLNSVFYSGKLADPDLKEHKNRAARKCLSPLINQWPSVVLIPAIRKLDAGARYELDGRGIIQTLADWQHPPIGQDALSVKFDRLNELLQRLMSLPDIRLAVPPNRDVIIVENGSLRLPLASYGTGIHELIILAIAVYSHEQALICLEEPELHMHPLLQKEFMRFLLEETSNRYLITTHSHALMTPSVDVMLVHLWQRDGVTHGRTVESTQHSLEVLRDLGIDASDLLQTRSVIWVEGPSDAVYLNRWLELVAPDLKLGIDYTVMFYGGRLLSHVSMEREDEEFPDPDDLVPLLKINQYSAIIIDSDRKNSSAPIRDTKLRVQQECERSNLPCWVTDGREIENYLSLEAITDAYTALTGVRKELKLDTYGHLEKALEKAYSSEWQQKWSYNRAKVKMARLIAPHIKLEHLTGELKGHVDVIAAMIRGAGA